MDPSRGGSQRPGGVLESVRIRAAHGHGFHGFFRGFGSGRSGCEAVLLKAVFNGLVIVQADPYLYPLITSAIIFGAVLLDGLRRKR